jgi:serine/threonine-protein kinase
VSSKPERFGCPKCLSVFRSGFPRCPLDGSVLQTLTSDPLIGFVLADRYVIENLIGEGGMGRVYRARHIRMSRKFAIKVLFGDLSADGKARSRFSREAEASSRLSHPNVVSVVDFGETEEGLLYLVMDHIEGEELHRIVGKQAPFGTARTLNLLRQLARGLGHAHERGLVHRDFKTENVLITRDGDDEIARIVDFGIAVVAEMKVPDQRLTTEGMVLGTPAYMSPEQSTGEEIDQRSDLFSLGVMIYEMLCGRLPFDGTPIAMAKANLAARVPAITERVPGLRVDGRLESIAQRLMAKEAADRFQSAADLLAHIDHVFGRKVSDTEPAPLPGDLVVEEVPDFELPIAADTPPPSPRLTPPQASAAPLTTGEVVAITGAVPRTRSRMVPIALGVTVMLGAGGALWASLRSGGETTVKERPLAAAEIPPDAGAATAPPTPSPVADAAVVPVAAPPDAAPATPSKTRHGKRPRDRRPKEVVVTPPIPPQPTGVTPAEFDKLYRRVGALLDRLSNAKGDAAAGALRDRYFKIPYADALRSDSVRKDAHRTLRTLSDKIEAQLAKKQP